MGRYKSYFTNIFLNSLTTRKSLKKKFIYDFLLEMIDSCPMKEKTLFCMIKIQNLQEIILLIMFFKIEFFITIAFYQFF